MLSCNLALSLNLPLLALSSLLEVLDSEVRVLLFLGFLDRGLRTDSVVALVVDFFCLCFLDRIRFSFVISPGSCSFSGMSDSSSGAILYPFLVVRLGSTTAYAAFLAPDLVLRTAFFIFLTSPFRVCSSCDEMEWSSSLTSTFALCSRNHFSRSAMSRILSCLALRSFKYSSVAGVLATVLPDNEAMSPPRVATLAKLSFPIMAFRAPPSKPVLL
mmetsp:Transcript_1344/g.3102  ORF Transcript_1344/g.3102 Transcript_1344/m.3102 type:complete len:215 (+) Transcript_1344:1763-2407(+)